MKTHSKIGYEILKKNSGLDDIPIIIRHHHERVDGKGYPDGICGDDIPIGSRIIALGDSLDAMLTNRTYRQKLDFDSAVEEIIRCRGTQFDKNIVDKFLCIIKDSEIKSKIKEIFLLNNNI
jgi:HD-GYP domain-containing protein (c-di-GMP phosphodiesterase class II)